MKILRAGSLRDGKARRVIALVRGRWEPVLVYMYFCLLFFSVSERRREWGWRRVVFGSAANNGGCGDSGRFCVRPRRNLCDEQLFNRVRCATLTNARELNCAGTSCAAGPAIGVFFFGGLRHRAWPRNKLSTQTLGRPAPSRRYVSPESVLCALVRFSVPQNPTLLRTSPVARLPHYRPGNNQS